MKRASCMALIVSAIGLALPAMAEEMVDVTGDWSLTFQGRQGPRTMDVTFAQDGGALTGTVTGPRGNEMPLTGSIEGAAIQFTVTFSTPRGEFEIVYAGTVEGGAMKGTAEIRGNEVEWSAERK